MLKRKLTFYSITSHAYSNTIKSLKANQAAGAASAGPGPLWAVQTKMLLCIFGVFSGKSTVVKTTIEDFGFFAIVSKMYYVTIDSKLIVS
jgi:hypothetical protein